MLLLNIGCILDELNESLVSPYSCSIPLHKILDIVYKTVHILSTKYPIYIEVLFPYFVGHYQIPSMFFISNTRLNNLLQVIENALPPLVSSALLCGFHYTPDVSCLL